MNTGLGPICDENLPNTVFGGYPEGLGRLNIGASCSISLRTARGASQVSLTLWVPSQFTVGKCVEPTSYVLGLQIDCPEADIRASSSEDRSLRQYMLLGLSCLVFQQLVLVFPARGDVSHKIEALISALGESFFDDKCSGC